MVEKAGTRLIVLVLMIAFAVPLGAATVAGDHPEPPASVALNHWRGFIACGIGTPLLVGELCADIDSNSETLHAFTAGEDLKTLVVAMEWDSPTLNHDNLQIALEEEGTGFGGPQIASASGDSPLEFRIDEGDDFDPLDEPWDLQFRVFPAFEAGVIYQQTFRVHYHEFYGQHAPAGYSALPDA